MWKQMLGPQKEKSISKSEQRNCKKWMIQGDQHLPFFVILLWQWLNFWVLGKGGFVIYKFEIAECLRKNWIKTMKNEPKAWNILKKHWK